MVDGVKYNSHESGSHFLKIWYLQAMCVLQFYVHVLVCRSVQDEDQPNKLQPKMPYLPLHEQLHILHSPIKKSSQRRSSGWRTYWQLEQTRERNLWFLTKHHALSWTSVVFRIKWIIFLIYLFKLALGEVHPDPYWTFYKNSYHCYGLQRTMAFVYHNYHVWVLLDLGFVIEIQYRQTVFDSP